MNLLAFLSDFHPVAVHFPIALLPTVALLALYQRLRPEAQLGSAIRSLLWLALLACLCAMLLGIGNRAFNGHGGEQVNSHAILGIATTVSVMLVAFLYQFPHWALLLTRGLVGVSGLALRIGWAVFRALWIIVRALLRFVLIPVRLLLWCSARLLPKVHAGLEVRRQAFALRVKQAAARIRYRLHTVIFEYLRPDGSLWWQNGALATSVVLVLATGLYGANLSHGEDHLTRNMPQALRTLLLEDQLSGSQLDQTYFDKEVQPVLRRSCVKCHGDQKQKKNLRLDSYAAVVGSGVVKYQNPEGSELLRRLLLPRDHTAAMPPLHKGRPLQTDDITVVVHWLQGHSLESLVSQTGGLAPELKALARQLPAIDEKHLSKLNTLEGLRVRRLVNNYDLLTVNLSHVAPVHIEAALNRLAPYAANVLYLDASNLQLTATQWQRLSGFGNLQRLNLKSSNIGTAEIQYFKPLAQLQWLNLFSTDVALSVAEIRAMMPGLNNIYLSAAESES